MMVAFVPNVPPKALTVVVTIHILTLATQFLASPFDTPLRMAGDSYCCLVYHIRAAHIVFEESTRFFVRISQGGGAW